MFLNDAGGPLELTPTQLELFEIIFGRKHKRVHLMAHTRWGKSLITALAVLLRVASHREKWAIVAPSTAKAKIIMGYIIDHTFDNEYTKQKLMLEEGESIEHLRRERSRNRLTFRIPDKGIGEVFILSADARNKQLAGDALMGFGAPSVVLDEAALIDDDIEAKIFRMLGDQMDNFYLKIGNPFRRNHFLRDFRDPNFYKMNIDYTVGLKEGRLTQEFIDEARKKPHFNVLYENKFPESEAVDSQGWSQLITDKEYENALVSLPQVAWFGDRLLGHDVARGGRSFNTWVLRTKNYATIIGKNQDPDLMSVTGTTIRLGKEYDILSENWFIDDIGTGGGEVDRLREQGFNPHAVVLSNKAVDFIRFENKRAENCWRLKQWINEGGKLDANCDWSEILNIKYKARDSTGRLQIMPKDMMLKQGIESPDTFDALMLTFDEYPYNVGEVMIQEKMNEGYDYI